MIHKPVAVATASTFLKFSTLPAFLVIASVSHISLPTAFQHFLSFFCFPHLLTYSVNTSSSQHFQHFLSFFCFPHPLTYSVNTSSSQHFQHFLPLLLFPTSPYLQRQHFQHFLSFFCFPRLLTYSVNTSSS